MALRRAIAGSPEHASGAPRGATKAFRLVLAQRPLRKDQLKHCRHADAFPAAGMLAFFSTTALDSTKSNS